MDLMQRFYSLIKARDWTGIIAISEPALGTTIAGDGRAVALAAHCMALNALGRTGDAAQAYAHHIRLIPKTDQQRNLAMVLTAAIAAGDGATLEQLFQWKFPHARRTAIKVSRISDLKNWCEQNAAPFGFLDAESNPANAATAMTTHSYAVGIIEGAEIVCGWDFVATPSGEILRDSGYSSLDAVYSNFFTHIPVHQIGMVAHPWPTESTDIAETALFLSTPASFQIGHWIIDFLPRLRALKHLEDDVKIALPREAPQKFRDLLACIGITADRLVFCDLGKRYRFRRLIVAKCRFEETPNPSNIGFLRQYLAPAEVSDPEINGYYFVRDIGTRQIVNETDFYALLDEFRIRRISLARLTIAEQREALAKARVLIGTYGSDLLACLMAPAGAHAIELEWGDGDMTRAWCTGSGLHHQYLLCAPAAQAKLSILKKDRDLIVDCDELRQRLRQILAP